MHIIKSISPQKSPGCFTACFTGKEAATHHAYKLFKMKKIKRTERKAGVWLDQENAFIVHITGEEVDKVEGLVSDVESRVRIAGEGKVYARFGHAFLDNQETIQHRQQNQRQHFFKDITAHLAGVDYIYIFGPGRARSGLKRQLEKNEALQGPVVKMEAAVKMNKRQAMATAIEYFKSEEFRLYKKDRKRILKAAL